MNHQKLLETDHAETAQLANSSLYCSQTPFRPIIHHEQPSVPTKLVHIQLAEDEAMLEITEEGKARVSTQLLLLTAHSYMSGIPLSFNCLPLSPPHTPTHIYNMQVQLPISVGGQGTGSFPLPKVVKASFGDQVVTVRLPEAQLEIQSRGKVHLHEFTCMCVYMHACMRTCTGTLGTHAICNYQVSKLSSHYTDGH